MNTDINKTPRPNRVNYVRGSNRSAPLNGFDRLREAIRPYQEYAEKQRGEVKK